VVLEELEVREAKEARNRARKQPLIHTQDYETTESPSSGSWYRDLQCAALPCVPKALEINARTTGSSRDAYGMRRAEWITVMSRRPEL
jgi:hypothetical protein